MEAIRCLADDGDDIRGIVDEGVAAAGHPVAFAMAALVDRDSAHARVCDPPRGGIPCASGLATAMEEQHGLAVAIPDIGGETIAVRSGEFDGPCRCHARLPCIPWLPRTLTILTLT